MSIGPIVTEKIAIKILRVLLHSLVGRGRTAISDMFLKSPWLELFNAFFKKVLSQFGAEIWSFKVFQLDVLFFWVENCWFRNQVEPPWFISWRQTSALRVGACFWLPTVQFTVASLEQRFSISCYCQFSSYWHSSVNLSDQSLKLVSYLR
jgi:hypothetical protein